MIFLKQSQNAIWIPKHGSCDTELTLTLKHNLTGTEYVYDNLKDIGDNSGYWIFYNMDFTDLQSGEYTYKLNDIETGLLQVMYQLSEPISYRAQKTIIQYGD